MRTFNDATPVAAARVFDDTTPTAVARVFDDATPTGVARTFDDAMPTAAVWAFDDAIRAAAVRTFDDATPVPTAVVDKRMSVGIIGCLLSDDVASSFALLDCERCDFMRCSFLRAYMDEWCEVQLYAHILGCHPAIAMLHGRVRR